MGGLRVQYQPITLTLAGYAQGRKIARKTRARPRNGRASSWAKPTPRLSLATLVTAAYTTVTVAARQNSGSARKRRDWKRVVEGKRVGIEGGVRIKNRNYYVK